MDLVNNSELSFDKVNYEIMLGHKLHLHKVTYFCITSKINRYKSYPNNTRRIHSETYKLRFVEILGNVPRLQSVNGAKNYKEEVES